MFIEKIFNCPYCGELISNKVSCSECEQVLRKLCNFKKLKTANCDEIMAPFIYDGVVRSAVLDYKFGGKFDNCESFAFFMQNCNLSSVDFIIGVPCFNNRKKFKIIKNLVLAFSRLVCLKKNFCVVKKVKQTKLQHECGLNQRLTNLKGAFEVIKKKKVLNKSILICDDIVTSASTVDELASVLKKAGARRVSAISVAVSKVILKHGLAKLL